MTGAAPTRTSLTPPRLSSLPGEREALEYSSRALVFVDDGRRLLRAWGSPERPWVVGVEPQGDRWRVEAWGAGPREARAAVRALFSLDHPLEAFYRLTRREPTLRGSERRFRGLRLPRDASVYEALLHSIVGQQLSVAAAATIKGRILDRMGGRTTVEGIDVPSVPPPSRVLREGPLALRRCGLSRAKAQALVSLARWAASGGRTSGDLAVDPLPKVRSALEQLPGVGPWTAENALLRGVGRPDVFVAGDLGLRVALDRFGALPRSAREDAARAWAGRWYPGWGSYATLYLWRKLVAERAEGRVPAGQAGALPSGNVPRVR